MRDATSMVLRAAERAGTPAGIFAATAAAATAAWEQGFRYVVAGSDIAMLAAGARALRPGPGPGTGANPH